MGQNLNFILLLMFFRVGPTWSGLIRRRKAFPVDPILFYLLILNANKCHKWYVKKNKCDSVRVYMPNNKYTNTLNRTILKYVKICICVILACLSSKRNTLWKKLKVHPWCSNHWPNYSAGEYQKKLLLTTKGQKLVQNNSKGIFVVVAKSLDFSHAASLSLATDKNVKFSCKLVTENVKF